MPANVDLANTPAKVDLIAAARPNFMKVAPLYKVLAAEDWCRPRIVHTGQHYDANMSEWFFRDLGMPAPHLNLEVGSGSHAEQTAGVMVAYEKACLEDRPDWTVVVGDVNSTIACALAAKKLGIAVAHLEAGLRSNDRTMPEEINRVATDAISDLFWTPSTDGDENLLREGVAPERIHLVGNIMIDSLEMMRPKIEARRYFAELGFEPRGYGVATLHRPSNVDTPEQLSRLVDVLVAVAARTPVVFPVHPRTRQRLASAGLDARLDASGRVRIMEPAGYIDFMSLVFDAAFVLTDSGGVQEETTYLGVPCMTLRENTERPVTVTQGTNRLLRVDQVVEAAERIAGGLWPKGSRPALWDGRTAGRVAASLRASLRAGVKSR
jgi:UDP-N-acetylglucosamine 2-epimerase (non-hydrolysing)